MLSLTQLTRNLAKASFRQEAVATFRWRPPREAGHSHNLHRSNQAKQGLHLLILIVHIFIFFHCFVQVFSMVKILELEIAFPIHMRSRRETGDQMSKISVYGVMLWIDGCSLRLQQRV